MASRRGEHAERSPRSKSAHNAVNRGRRSQNEGENMGRRSSSFHPRLAKRLPVEEPLPEQLSAEELEWLRRKVPAKKGRA